MSSHKKRILVVDDDDSMSRFVGMVVVSAGHFVMRAEDGKEGLTYLREEVFDLLITDWEMPNMNGIDLTRTVRADERLSGLPIIMLTGKIDEKHEASALKNGVDVFLRKTDGELVHTIKTAIQKLLARGMTPLPEQR